MMNLVLQSFAHFVHYHSSQLKQTKHFEIEKRQLYCVFYYLQTVTKLELLLSNDTKAVIIFKQPLLNRTRQCWNPVPMQCVNENKRHLPRVIFCFHLNKILSWETQPLQHFTLNPTVSSRTPGASTDAKISHRHVASDRRCTNHRVHSGPTKRRARRAREAGLVRLVHGLRTHQSGLVQGSLDASISRGWRELLIACFFSNESSIYDPYRLVIFYNCVL